MSETVLPSAVNVIARCEIPYVRAMIDAALSGPRPTEWLERDILELLTYCISAGIELGEGLNNGSMLAIEARTVSASDLMDGLEAGARIATQELAARQPDPSAVLDAYRFGEAEGYQRARDELTNGGLL